MQFISTNRNKQIINTKAINKNNNLQQFVNTAPKRIIANFIYSAKIIKFAQNTQSSQDPLRPPESKLFKGPGT